MVDQPILEKIKKLLRLAADPSNPHEAALAAERAQELLYRHKLAMADVTALDDQLKGVIETERRVTESWRQVLAAVIAKANYVRIVQDPLRGIFRFIGASEDLDVTLYLYVYLSRTIAHLARDAWAQRVRDLTDPILGKHPALCEPGAESEWKESFRIGAVEVIAVRLDRARRGHDAERQFGAMLVGPEAGALVRAATTLVKWETALDAYMARKYPNLRQASDLDVSINMDGFIQGGHAGRSLPLHRGLRGGSDPRKLS